MRKDDQSFDRIKRTFLAARELKPDERPAFLERECGSDAELISEVERLLAVWSEEFLEEGAVKGFAEFLEREGTITDSLIFGKEIPATIGKYDIIAPIGRGGMGEVFLARDTKLGRKVAIKFLLPRFNEDPERLERFTQEAMAASTFNDPNIVTVHDIGSHEGISYLVSEYVEGKSLRSCLKQNDLDTKQKLEIATQIASALGTAHAAGIIHRDIKPDNIRIREDGLVKVIDFGLAKLSESVSASGLADSDDFTGVSTVSGVIMGTPDYMSPEQARGLPVDARSDIFSFGIVLYEMLTGQKPFLGETVADRIISVVEKEPIPVTELAPGLPSELCSVVGKALEKDPEERFQSAHELKQTLVSIRETVDDRPETGDGAGKVTDEEMAETDPLRPASTFESGRLIQRVAALPKTIYLLLFLLMAGIVAVLYAYTSGYFAAASIEKKPAYDSLAILRFENTGKKSEIEHFTFGIPDSLRIKLSSLPSLKTKDVLSARTAQGDADPKKIGKELNVNAVLTGYVSGDLDQLEIRTRLINAESGDTISEKRYTGPANGIIALEGDIALEVAQALGFDIQDKERTALTRNYTEHYLAYESYMEGRLKSGSIDIDVLKESELHYRKALEYDPGYALAWSALADLFLKQSQTAEFLESKEAQLQMRLRAERAAAKALEFAPELVDTRSTLGMLRFQELKFEEAEEQFKKAIEIDPDNFLVRWRYAYLLKDLLRFDEALEQAREAERIDPFGVGAGNFIAEALFRTGREKEAIEKIKEVIAIKPHVNMSRLRYARFISKQGKHDEALEILRGVMKTRKQGLIDPFFLQLEAQFLITAGRTGEARQVLRKMMAPYNDLEHLASSGRIAFIYAELGEKEEAFKWLYKAVEEKEEMGGLLGGNKSLHSDPRYKELLRNLGYPEDAIRRLGV